MLIDEKPMITNPIKNVKSPPYMRFRYQLGTIVCLSRLDSIEVATMTRMSATVMRPKPTYTGTMGFILSKCDFLLSGKHNV